MAYLVRLAARAARDLEAIYEFVGADSSQKAFSWFNELAAAVDSLERFAERGPILRGNKKYRSLLFGKGPSTYKIIYTVDKRNRAVNVLHIRHCARVPLRKIQE